VSSRGYSLVVAYDLTKTDQRAPGQILFKRATRWTDPPRVTADLSSLLGQTVIPPWVPQILSAIAATRRGSGKTVPLR
jgi:hypothetical protein